MGGSENEGIFDVERCPKKNQVVQGLRGKAITSFSQQIVMK
jgi:hypothetical protein